MVRRRPCGRMNEYKTLDGRYAYARREMESLRQALIKGFEINEVEKKKRPEIVHKVEMPGLTFREAIEISIGRKQEQNREAETIRGYRRIITYLEEIYPTILEKVVDEVKKADIDMFMSELRRKNNLQGKTYNNYVGTISAVFNTLRRLGRKIDNPATNLDRMSVKRGNQNIPFTTDQLSAIFKYAKSIGQGQFVLFAKFGFYTLFRPRKELRLLQIKHIKDTSIFLPPELAKTDNGRHNPIFPGLETEIKLHDLRSYPGEYYIFGSEGKPGPKPTFINHFYDINVAILESLGFTDKKYTLYSYKHSGACQFYLSGFSVRQIMELAGHKDEKTTQIYLQNMGIINPLAGMMDRAPII